MKEIRIERWESDDNGKEIHFFFSENRSDYVLGFNPNLIPLADVIEFLKKYNLTLP